MSQWISGPKIRKKSHQNHDNRSRGRRPNGKELKICFAAVCGLPFSIFELEALD